MDAKAIARRFQSREIRRPNTTLLDEPAVSGPEIVGLTESQFVESEVKTKLGLGRNWRVYGAVDSDALIINASGFQDFWSWEKVRPIAVQMVTKVHCAPEAGLSE